MQPTADPAPAPPETLPESDAEPAPSPTPSNAQPAAPWTREQTIGLVGALGTWAAAFATFAAVAVSLRLARRSERIDLKINCGVRADIAGDGTPPRRFIGIAVVSRQDRPVSIDWVGWKVGRGRTAQHVIQMLSPTSVSRVPMQLVHHGQRAMFQLYLDDAPTWAQDFATNFVGDLSDRRLKTLRALVQTSTGQTLEVVPEKNVLELLREAATAGKAAT